MKKRILVIIYGLLIFSTDTFATVYDLTPWFSLKGGVYATNSPCPGKGSYNYNLTTYTCASGFTLNAGDTILTNYQTRWLRLKKYVTFNGSNTVGSRSNPLSLDLNGNSFAASSLILNGHIDNGNYIELSHSAVLGVVRSSKDGVKLFYTNIGSYVEAKKQIQITHGNVGGYVYSSHGGVEISALGSTKIIDGYITAKNEVEVTNYQVNQSISSGGYIELQKTNVTGSLTSQSNGGSAIVVSNNSSISGDVLTKGHVSISYSNVEGNIDNTQGSNQSMSIISSQVGGNIFAKGYVDVQSSQVSGTVFSANDGGQVNNSKIKGNVEVKKYLHVIENSYVCGLTSSSNDGANISNSYVGDDVSTKNYLHVTNSFVFGTASVENQGMALSSAKILADAKSISFPSNKYIEISNDTTLCGTANSSYSYGRNLVAYCGLNDPSCSAQQSKGTCPVDLVSSSEYRDFYDYCGITPPEPEPEPEQCTVLPMEEFSSNALSNWSVMDFRNSDDSDYPGVYGGRFVLNSNEPEQATASAYNYTFPSDQNYLEIEFDHYAYGGTGADGVALVISDASVPPKTGAFGGPLGYGMKLYKNHSNEISQDIEGFAGGWLGIGIDEYGNFYREGSVELAGHGIADNVGIRGAGIKDDNGKWLKGYEYIKGQKYGKSLDNRHDTPHRYKVILNSRDSGAITLSVWRNVGDSEDWGEPVIEEFDLLTEGGFNYTPDNFRISVTASTGALTNTHAVDNFQVCADKYQKITNGIHHFEFDYAGTGSICQASEVTLRACMNESCTETYPSSVSSSGTETDAESVTVSLLPQSSSLVAWESGDGATFSDTVSLKLRAFQSGSAKLGISSSSVTQFGFEGAKCRVAGGELSEENCTISFNSAALGVNVPDKVAGKQFFNDDGQAQYSNQNSPYLEFCSSPSQQGGNGENRDIQLSIERKEPINNAVSIPAYVSFKKRDGSFSSEVTVGTSSVDIADVYFNSQGKAYFDLRYPEAGKVALKAKIKGEEDSLGQNSFVSFPEYLTVTTGGECGSGSCQNGFVAAGETFTMTVTAHQFGGAEAKNYQQTGLVISHKVSYPTSVSAVPGKLNVSVYDHTQPENGAVSIEQTVSEVGAFEFTVTPPDSYLGSNAFPIAPAVANIGRFYPKYFRIYDSVDNKWAYPSGQSFTYMGQSFGAAEFYVEALNSAKGSVNNYQFFESKLQTHFSLEDSGSYTSRFSALKTYSGNWQSNQLTGVDSRSIGRFGSSASDGFIMHKDMDSYQPDGPLNLYQNGSDTEISINGFGVGENVDPVAVDGNDGLLNIQPDIRFGRVNLDDVGGRQGDTLRIPLRVEYWNSKLERFVQNIDDDGTVIYSVLDGNPETIWPDDKSDCSILLEGNDTVTDGATRELLARQDPNTCNPVGRQQSRLWLQLEGGSNNLPWLKYDWDNDGEEENPSSVVTFGIHRGNDRVIYRGEPGLTAQ